MPLWSMNLFRIGGIRLAVHASFLPLLAYAGYAGWEDAARLGRAAQWSAMGGSLLFVALLFACVTLHELGHSFMARRFGVGVPRILLLPFGGMAEFDSIPREPRRELLITLAGPAVNFALAGALLVFTRFPHGLEVDPYSLQPRAIFRHLVIVNLAMGLFNLAPVFPMDGGRIFRALLAARLPYLKATRIAVAVGKVGALAGVLLMVFHFKAYLVAGLFAFIFVAGELEWRAIRREDEAEGRADSPRTLAGGEWPRPAVADSVQQSKSASSRPGRRWRARAGSRRRHYLTGPRQRACTGPRATFTSCPSALRRVIPTDPSPTPRGEVNGAVAQLIERVVRNDEVAGLIPVCSTIPHPMPMPSFPPAKDAFAEESLFLKINRYDFVLMEANFGGAESFGVGAAAGTARFLGRAPRFRIGFPVGHYCNAKFFLQEGARVFTLFRTQLHRSANSR